MTITIKRNPQNPILIIKAPTVNPNYLNKDTEGSEKNQDTLNPRT